MLSDYTRNYAAQPVWSVMLVSLSRDMLSITVSLFVVRHLLSGAMLLT